MITKENLDHYIDYFKVYFNRSSEYYIERLEWYLSGKRMSFNIFAFFFNALWLAYRKMYKKLLLVMLIAFLTGILISILDFSGLLSSSTLSDVEMISYLLIPSFVGIFANKWYIKKSISTIENTMTQESNTEKMIELLKKKGGTSVIAPIILFTISILLTLLGETLE
jgi:hypothetical protein